MAEIRQKAFNRTAAGVGRRILGSEKSGQVERWVTQCEVSVLGNGVGVMF